MYKLQIGDLRVCYRNNIYDDDHEVLLLIVDYNQALILSGWLLDAQPGSILKTYERTHYLLTISYPFGSFST
jgi:hypothetical protein